MNNKNIVFIGHYSGGENDYDTRHYFLARELVKLGHKASIINGAYSHRLAFPQELTKPFETHQDNRVDFISIKTPKYEGNGIGRIINIFAFVKNIIFHARKIIQFTGKFDTVVVASPHPFQSYAAKYLAKKNKAKLIVDIKDIWPLSVTELTGVSKFHPFIIVAKITEILMYKYSNLIISPLNNVQQYFVDSNYPYKTVYIPTGIDIAFYHDIVKNTSLPKEKFVIGYIGGVNEANAIGFLLSIAVELEEKYKDIIFVIVGKGAHKKRLLDKYSKNKNIKLYDSVTKKEAYSIMKRCDILYKSLLPHSIFRYGISPLKLNEYMYSGTPIIHVFDFPQNDLVVKSGCGLCSKYGDTEALEKNILEIYGMSKKERDKMGRLGKKYVSEKLSFSRIAKELEKLL